MEENKNETGAERRRFKRLNIGCEVSYRILSLKPPKSGKSKTRNISAGGICLIASDKLNLGSSLGLNFFLPNEKTTIKAKGRVVWINPFKIAAEKEHYDYGVEFTEIKSTDQKLIDQYIFSYK